MKLWLLSQKVVTGYDTHDSVVVAAETEEAARGIHPIGGPLQEDDDWDTWPSLREKHKIQCELIGEAVEGTKEGVILASFNAG